MASSEEDAVWFVYNLVYRITPRNTGAGTFRSMWTELCPMTVSQDPRAAAGQYAKDGSGRPASGDSLAAGRNSAGAIATRIVQN